MTVKATPGRPPPGAPAIGRHDDPDVAAGGRRDRQGVRDEVAQDPLERLAIRGEAEPARPACRVVRDLGQVTPAAAAPGPNRATVSVDDAAAASSHSGRRPGRAVAQPLERVELVDQALQPGGLLGDGAGGSRRVVAGRGPVGECRGEPADDRERRPQVVAEVGQQARLAGAGVGQLGGHRVEPVGQLADLGGSLERQERASGRPSRGRRWPRRGVAAGPVTDRLRT